MPTSAACFADSMCSIVCGRILCDGMSAVGQIKDESGIESGDIVLSLTYLHPKSLALVILDGSPRQPTNDRDKARSRDEAMG